MNMNRRTRYILISLFLIVSSSNISLGLGVLLPYSTVMAANIDSSLSAAIPIQQVLDTYNPSGMRADGFFVDELLKKVMAEIGKTKPPLAGDFPKVRVEKIPIARDAFAEINELFYKRGWTDGLPIVPPTEERVKEMLKGSDLSPNFIVGTLYPMRGQATVEKIAVNAVMAGCRPEYMPVLIAAVDAIMDPAFDQLGLSTTTSPDTHMLIISGPIAKQLNINSGTNALGRGWKANASIGRAFHLIVQNVGGSWPGVNDMSTLGNPGEFAMCLAENDEQNPWTPLSMDLGYPKNANLVTVLGVTGTQNIVSIGMTNEQFLQRVSDLLAAEGTLSRDVMLLILPPEVADQLVHSGWTKESVRQAISQYSSIPFSEFKKRFIDTGKSQRVPSWVLEVKDPNMMIPRFFINQFLILVSGGPGEKNLLIPNWNGNKKAVSKEIRLPWNWGELLQEEKKQGLKN
jgi:hypothetical protein